MLFQVTLILGLASQNGFQLPFKMYTSTVGYVKMVVPNVTSYKWHISLATLNNTGPQTSGLAIYIVPRVVAVSCMSTGWSALVTAGKIPTLEGSAPLAYVYTSCTCAHHTM